VTCDIDEHVARVFLVDAAGNLAAGIFIRAEYALEIGEARVAQIDDVLLAIAELLGEKRGDCVGVAGTVLVRRQA
jgi:hypothetical protein